MAGEEFARPGPATVRGDRAEQLRLGADHCQIGQAVAAQRDRDGEIRDDLARIVPQPSRPLRREVLVECWSSPAISAVRSSSDARAEEINDSPPRTT